MNLVVCLDIKDGYSFASRRQSRDIVQVEKMQEIVGENKLFVNEYSASLLKEKSFNLIVCDNPIEAAGEEDFCFVENLELKDVIFNKIVIYRWNRHYPSDKKFPEQLLLNKKLVSSIEFKGNSHQKITEEIFE